MLLVAINTNLMEIARTIMQLFLFFGIPLFLFVIGAILLIRVFMSSTVSTGRKPIKVTTLSKVLDKREHNVSTLNGFATFYYVTFEIDKNDKIEHKVSKSEFKKVNYGDKVKITHNGTKLICLEIVEKSNITSKASFTSSVNLTDII